MNLDEYGFAPFGVVVEGMEHVDKLYKGSYPPLGRDSVEF